MGESIKAYLEEVGVLGLPLDDLAVDLDLYLLPLLLLVGHVPAGETRLTLPVLQQDKSNLHSKIMSYYCLPFLI